MFAKFMSAKFMSQAVVTERGASEERVGRGVSTWSFGNYC